MTRHGMLLFLILLVAACAHTEQSTPAPEFSTVRVLADPPGAFEIEGTGVSGARIADLSDALRAHARNATPRNCEVVSDWKLTLANEDLIRAEVRNAGYELIHLWVPTSEPQPASALGPHDTGYVDAL